MVGQPPTTLMRIALGQQVLQGTTGANPGDDEPQALTADYRLSSLANMDVLNAHELRPAVPEPAQSLDLRRIGPKQARCCARHHCQASITSVSGPDPANTAIVAEWVAAICITRAASTSSRGFAPSINARAALTAVSERPPPGSLAARINWLSDASMKSGETVAKACLSLRPHSWA
jgi:hypothetical protein